MLTQIIIFISLFLTGLAAGIYFYQFTGGTPAYRAVSARTFIEYHKKLDSFMTVRMPPFFLAGQASILVWLFLEKSNYAGFTFMMVATAFISTLVELIALFRGNRPINFKIQTWDLENYPEDWATYRDKWLSYFNIRIVTGILTFTCLLIAAVFKK
ncbi:DUF1772 domain-containing protein [Mucilaginibacter flavidus]|uniref:DUF1772 domain-containing protein n=1 Tax=Mucilaginibacter flavidus TaxID=2949309 RepID=UPI002092E7E2|nr:DUF1772 domain-containing protein [Mucilaginibacter flavidus]MCO5949888.1 DUF1772 domain-containing protein [Mucilaginibacter flavidus]